MAACPISMCTSLLVELRLQQLYILVNVPFLWMLSSLLKLIEISNFFVTPFRKTMLSLREISFLYVEFIFRDSDSLSLFVKIFIG